MTYLLYGLAAIGAVAILLAVVLPFAHDAWKATSYCRAAIKALRGKSPWWRLLWQIPLLWVSRLIHHQHGVGQYEVGGTLGGHPWGEYP